MNERSERKFINGITAYSNVVGMTEIYVAVEERIDKQVMLSFVSLSHDLSRVKRSTATCKIFREITADTPKDWKW